MSGLDAIPAELRSRPQWVVWRSTLRPGNDKPSKIPFDARTGKAASTTDPATWTDFTTAMAAAPGYSGLGFVFTPEDPYVGIDLDKVVSPATGEIEPGAADILRALDSYTELSVSGTGVHVIVRGIWPRNGNRKGAAEVYSQGRYFCMTGRPVDGFENKPIADRPAELAALHARMFAPAEVKKPGSNGSRPSAAAAHLDDEELLRRARAADNGAKFRKLYDDGDTGEYDGDHSRADLALCGMLAFWTGGDTTRMDRLFRGSRLYREKWDEPRGHATYGALTIGKALDDDTEHCRPDRPQVSDAETETDDAEDGEAPDHPSASQRLVRIGKATELFRNDRDEAFARFAVGDHVETWSLRSKAFRTWLARTYYNQTGRAPGSQAAEDALRVLEGEALYSGTQHSLDVRVARADGSVWYDLADPQWRAVRITADGWEIVTDAPLLFRRYAPSAPQVEPIRGGSLDELRRFLNVRDDPAWRLLVAWIVSALLPDIPHPVLVLHGEQGSAKSSCARLLTQLVSPSQAPLRAEPRELGEWILAADHSYVVSLDNVSRLPEWLSDALCRAVTGEAMTKRQLYTDSEDCVFAFRRVVILTGIEVAARRPDLLDRSILLPLSPIAPAERKPESELQTAFDRARARIVGALFDALAAAMRELPDVQMDRLPRMADFARVGVAVERALQWPRGSFMAAYEGNISAQNDEALAASPVAEALLGWMSADEWEGTASELLGELTSARKASEGSRDWPKTARVLGSELRRSAPNLRAAGLEVGFRRENARRKIVLTRISADSSVTTVTSVTHGGGERGGRDAKPEEVTQSAAGVTQNEATAARSDTHGDANDASDAKKRDCSWMDSADTSPQEGEDDADPFAEDYQEPTTPCA